MGPLNDNHQVSSYFVAIRTKFNVDALLFCLFSVTGSRKRSLEEDEDFGSMQVTAAQNR